MSTAVTHFIELRKEMTRLRSAIKVRERPLTDHERDLVAIATAEALADLAATMNSGISVTTD